MTESATLTLKVDSTDAKRATSSLDKLTTASGKAERASDKLGKAWGIALGVISSAVVATATREYIRAADAMANMSAKLRLVAGDAEGAAKAQKQLFDLSQATSSDLEATTDLYVKLGQSNKDLAANSELLLGITEKVSKALVISGADAASSAAVIRQFSQAMGAGALRGDEFISVMEGAPRLAQAIADGMGVATGALRGLAAEGKLTSETIIKALENQGDVLDREFGEMPLTVGRATQQVRNALTQLIGDTDQASGASRDLAESIAGLARVLESEDTKRGFATVVSGLASVISGATEAAGAVSELSRKLDEMTGVNLPEWAGVALRLATNNPVGAVGEFAKARATSPDVPAPRASEGIDFTLPAPGPSVFGGAAATAGLKARTAATRELTEAEKAQLQMEDEIAAHEEVATAALRDATNARLQKIIDEEDATERQRQATAGLIADMEFERSLIGMTNAEREKAVALRWAGANATDEQRAHIAALVDNMEKLREAQAVVDDIKFVTVDFAVSAGMNMSRAGDAFEQFGDRVKRIALQLLAEKAVQWLFGMFGASSYSSWGQANGIGAPIQVGGTTYGGARAAGGPVTAGSSYIVGDGGGPELFTPTQNGRVTPITTAQKGNNTYVTVENHGGNPARVERSTGPNGDQFVKVIIDQAKGAVTEDILRGGSTSRAMQSAFGLQRSGVPVSG